MAVSLINPAGLPEIPFYKQVSMATGTRLIHVAGQVAWEGGDFATQVEQCYLNVGTALAAAGATFGDVVKLTMHVVDWTPDRMPELIAPTTQMHAAFLDWRRREAGAAIHLGWLPRACGPCPCG